jgi:hypothetical protein
MVEQREPAERRRVSGGGRRSSDPQSGDAGVCSRTAQEVARLKTVVDGLAHAMQLHAASVRSLVDAVQALTATRNRPGSSDTP